MKRELLPQLKAIPPMVRIILTQAARRRANGGITSDTFDAHLRRLATEELNPHGLALVQRALSGGRTRFLIKDAMSGAIRDMLDFASDGTLEAESGCD